MKDRAAARMIADGEASGKLRPGLTIVDATSGNTGIAYAMIGAARGYKVKLCLPENASPERKLILRAFGAELVLTEPARRDRRRDSRSPPAGRRASRTILLPRPVQQRRQLARALRHDRPRDHRADRRPGHAFRRRARHQRHVHGHRAGACGSSIRRSRLISFQPDSPFHGLEGLKHMATAMVPAIYDPSLADEDLRVEHRGRAPAGAPAGARRRTAGRHFVRRGAGGDAAGRAHASNRGVVVTVFPDGAEKYLTEKLLDGRVTDDPRRCELERRRGDRDSPSRRGDVSARVLRRADRHRRRRRRPRCRCRTRPRKDRGAGFSCGRPTIGWPSSRRAELGGELLGFYHSHPDHPARPSQFDLDHAWPTFAYVIVSVHVGRRARHDRLVSERRSIQFR